ncbi:nucleotide exchange factor GrpE [Aureibacillus halotolerans]|uniref:Protein GrpE n=1 Tax=Aureibacillus halotolerans TaxID=1508390 RepID=A0A4R6TW37_9BACI|nr:nucleotide exchange factor GrpE [Aureibacillus halotolerans]TDQ38048.1 molecular chaperone GrpE [Aureibacillus halotolerans]
MEQKQSNKHEENVTEDTAEAPEEKDTTLEDRGDEGEQDVDVEILEADESSAEVAALQEKLQEAEQRLLRVQADYDNHRRRERNETAAREKYRAQGIVTELLPALDNFERALAVDAESADVTTVLKGVEMVHQQIKQALEKEGVTVIAAVGESFDPTFHQAVMQVSEEGVPSNQVVEEFQKGYMLKDRVLRPSMVKVNE